ncbi:hypothetical protein C7R54_02610 [Achromobacter aloeverae]|uniref:N-acetyltransferase domain-containing protein n=2 Tax=Achromobacter aloeverae TaxID=1750518 RepID=A0A4Q1HRJ2_9BURK|nr:hypothetical protein C7R54_02610 [Achromobacter aloeverae]
MFLCFGNLILSLAATLFIPPASAYALCTALYAALVVIELRCGIRSPISITLLLLYAGLLVLAFNGYPVRDYAGVLIFSWLTLLTGVLLLRKKPFTIFYSKARGMKPLHYTVSTLWCTVYACCLLCHALRFPRAYFLVVPYLLCIACALCTIFLHLCWFGRRHALQSSFAIGAYRFRRVHVDADGFDRFCRFYARQIVPPDDNRKADDLARAIAAMERELGRDACIFIAERGQEIVGCIRCILDRKQRPFPMETDMRLCFAPLRRSGRLLYIGRLAVDAAYRDRPDVLNGLFKCFVDLALSRDISFVVAEGLASRLPAYRKLGFEPMFASTDPRHSIRMSLGYDCHPIYLNFARLVFLQGSAAPDRYGFAGFVNRYLAERWFKRKALANILRPSGRWPWRFDLKQIHAAR